MNKRKLEIAANPRSWAESYSVDNMYALANTNHTGAHQVKLLYTETPDTQSKVVWLKACRTALCHDDLILHR